MIIKFMEMNIKSAEEIAGWVYAEPYSLFSFELNDQTLEELMNGCYFQALNGSDDLIGYICLGKSAQVPPIRYDADDYIDIGLSLRPDLYGRGSGSMFMKMGMEYIGKYTGKNKFRLTVACFNKRAINVYEKSGFIKSNFFKKETEKGIIEFQIMIKE